jgi:hypothetical protein
VLGTQAIAHVGPDIVTGTAKALRRLTDGLVEAANVADSYDHNPDAWNDREHLER